MGRHTDVQTADLDRSNVGSLHDRSTFVEGDNLILEVGWTPDPLDDFGLQTEVDARVRLLEANMAQARTREGIQSRMANDDYHHGPAPLGFEKDDGKLYEADDYDEVVTVLEIVQKDELSKRKAARQLDSSRATINRALE